MTADRASPPPASLTFRREGALGLIVANNADRFNAYTSAMWAAIPGAVAAAESDPEVRVIVLRGAGTKAFSAGADISEFESARTGDSAAHYDALNHAAFEALLGATKPMVAMIHGFCLGGGLGIAACCDLRFADDKAQFAIPAAKLGLGYNPRWVRTLLTLAPPARIKELLFTGRRFDAGEALRMGLINRVVEPANLENTVTALAAEIAANAPLTVKAAKASIDALTRHPESADIARLEAMIDQCFASADYAEGRRAFLEKRKPQFQGH